jgi:GNAT superfamily N-acetyltransferase
MSPSMKGEMGVLIDGFEHPPTIMMSHSRPWYASLLKRCGLDVAKTFYAFRFISDDPQHAEKFVKMDQFQQRVNQRFPELRFEQISRDDFATSVHQVNHLGNEVRKVGWGFVPSTEAEIDAMIHNLGPIIRHEAFQVAYNQDELVGYVIAIPDINWALARTWGKWDWIRKLQLFFLLRRIPRSRIIALGAAEKFRTKGIAMLLIKRLIDRRMVFREWEMSWVLEDNVRSLRAIGRSVNLDRYKTWQLFEMRLK